MNAEMNMSKKKKLHSFFLNGKPPKAPNIAGFLKKIYN